MKTVLIQIEHCRLERPEISGVEITQVGILETNQYNLILLL